MRYSREVFILGFILVLCSSLGLAQEEKFELIIDFGYTASGGVDINATDIGGGVIVDRITPKGGFSYGGTFNVAISEATSLGFQFSQQLSTLEGRVQGGRKEDFSDLSVYNYHGIFTFHAADQDSPVRPFFLVGMGATSYRADNARNPVNLPEPGSGGVESRTKFSTTWGGGVKFFLDPGIGFELKARWTPTYIRSNAAGYYCSPFWPWQCWVVGDSQYSHQGEFGGGVVFRF
ncbi:MAG: outer membrane beta-barrel protein [Acidobacteria bacterium]|nr:outer membrane beta-barrel protein [Acidobacteriota bacterium]